MHDAGLQTMHKKLLSQGMHSTYRTEELAVKHVVSVEVTRAHVARSRSVAQCLLQLLDTPAGLHAMHRCSTYILQEHGTVTIQQNLQSI